MLNLCELWVEKMKSSSLFYGMFLYRCGLLPVQNFLATFSLMYRHTADFTLQREKFDADFSLRKSSYCLESVFRNVNDFSPTLSLIFPPPSLLPLTPPF